MARQIHYTFFYIQFFPSLLCLWFACLASSFHFVFDCWVLLSPLLTAPPGLGWCMTVAMAWLLNICVFILLSAKKFTTMLVPWVSNYCAMRQAFPDYLHRDILFNFDCQLPEKTIQGVIYLCVCVRVHACVCSVVSDFAAQWSVAHQIPLPMEFSRQE